MEELRAIGKFLEEIGRKIKSGDFKIQIEAERDKISISITPLCSELSNERTEESKQLCLFREITQLLNDLRIPPHLKGYKYIKDALMLVSQDETYLELITVNLYPKIAKLNGLSSWGPVEDGIRSAIKKSWQPENFVFIKEVFKDVSYECIPKNKEYIGRLAEYMKLNFF